MVGRAHGISAKWRSLFSLSLWGILVVGVLTVAACNIGNPVSGSTGTTAQPTFNPAGGTYTSAQSVSIADSSPGATIYYTTDGSTPTTSSSVFVSSSPINVSAGQTTQIEAVAKAGGLALSAVAAASYTVSSGGGSSGGGTGGGSTVAAPSFNVASGNLYATTAVTISDSTSGAKIYYTTDGSSPVTSGTRIAYSSPVSMSGVGNSITLKAYATESGLSASTTTSATYKMSIFSAPQRLYQSSTVVALAAGDLRGNSEQDLVGVEADGTLQVYFNNGAGLAGPTKVTAQGSCGTAHSVAVGDLDLAGNNYTDIAVGCNSEIDLYVVNPAGTVNYSTKETTSNSEYVAIGDVTGDGKADLVGLAWSNGQGGSTGPLSVFPQNPTGGGLGSEQQINVTENGYPDIKIGDVNNDGYNDIVILDGQGGFPTFDVVLQNPSGGFQTPVTYNLPGSSMNPNGFGVGDLNNDHKTDVAVGFGDYSPAPQIAEYLDNSTSTLVRQASTISAAQHPSSMSIFDVNGDGYNDIVAHNGHNWNVDIYLGSSSGAFTLFESVPGVLNLGKFVAADFTDDGKTDLAAAPTSGTNQGIVLYTHR